MKKLITLLALFYPFFLMAQQGNAIFFAENGERFYLVMNGQRYNDNPETNVKAIGLSPGPYATRIIFADTALGMINDKIYIEPDHEKTFNLRLKKVTDSEKSVKKVFNNLNPLESQKTSDNKNAQLENPAEKYVIRVISQNPLKTAPSATVAANRAAPAYSSAPATAATTTTHSTTTTVNATAPAPSTSANVSLNVNLGGTGTQMQYKETSTVTHTTTSGTSTTTHYVMPGYTGPVGCPWPMTESDYSEAKNSIASKNFEDSKLQIAKQIISSNCLFSSQVRDLMNLFTFETSKLDFAKYAYGYTYDTGNYFKVNDAFEFENSIDELNTYIGR